MIGAVIAMDSEAEALLDQMEIENILTVHGKPVYAGKAFGKDVLLCVCGVGKVNAAVGACAVMEKGAQVLLNFGVAGGLHEKTELTEVYLIDRAVQYDFDLTQLNGGKQGTRSSTAENRVRWTGKRKTFCPSLRPPRSTSPAARSPRAIGSTTPPPTMTCSSPSARTSATWRARRSRRCANTRAFRSSP